METNNPNRTWEFSRNILRCIANYPSPREVLRLVTNKEAALLIFSKQFLDWLRAVCVMSQSLARKLLLFANQIIRRRVSFDIILCFSVKAFWGFPALRCTFLLRGKSPFSLRDRSSRKWNSTYLRPIQTAFWLATKIHWEYIQDWILQMRTTEIWKIVCKLTGWLWLKNAVLEQ